VFFGCRHGNIRGAYEEMIRGAESSASGRGYQMLLVNSRNDVNTSFEQVMRLNEQRVAGTILVPIQSDLPQQATADLVAALRRSGQRVVLLDEFSADEKVPSICSQNREATYALTSHLIKLGHRRIAFASCLRTEPVAEREEGFRAAMEEHGLEIPPEYFLEVASRDPGRQGRQEVDVFMAMRQPPEAIVALHDLIAMNMIQRASERGWKVPQDVAIVGFDDLPQAAYSHPPLTTVHQPFHEMGALAVERLIEQLEKENAPVRHERLACNLVIRSSCGSTLRSKAA
jgi:DNA-binding LacI/PurR family transcriptional regulator